jgi:hemoglobin
VRYLPCRYKRRGPVSKATGFSARRSRWSVIALLLIVTVIAGAIGSFAQDKPKTLYQRIGGYDTIANVVDDFLGQLGKDPAFDRFGQGRGQDSLHRARQLIVDQICSLSGGPCTYIGRDMKTAHHGLAITKEEWESAGNKMAASLDKFKVTGKDKDEFMGLIDKLRPDIVEGPKPAATKGQD